jgi:purine-nucleoside phosphorylase
MGASTDSNYGQHFNLACRFAPLADYDLLSRAVDVAKKKGIKFSVGNILSSDAFYAGDKDALLKLGEVGILAVEMETAALYMTAANFKKKALCLLTISDNLITGEALSSKERQIGFKGMVEVALSLV